MRHGYSKTRIYSIWCGIKSRCNCKTNHFYKYYGGRGIFVCKEWDESFIKFLEDMGNPPPNYTIDRINNNLGYFKENCRWASRKEQMNNRECNIIIEYEGKKQTIMQWSEELNIPHQTLSNRYHKGFSIDKILSKEKFKDLSGLALGGIANGKRNKEKTHCKFGHRYNKENTRIEKSGARVCRRCHANRQLIRRGLAPK